jgi:hypothetical protein
MVTRPAPATAAAQNLRNRMESELENEFFVFFAFFVFCVLRDLELPFRMQRRR